MDNMYDLLVEENVELRKKAQACEEKFAIVENLLELMRLSENTTTHQKSIIDHCLDVINK
jgi:hypothetical protein